MFRIFITTKCFAPKFCPVNYRWLGLIVSGSLAGLVAAHAISTVNRQVSAVERIGVGEVRFDFRAGQIGHSAAAAPTFLRICVARTLNRGDGPCHSLHVLRVIQSCPGVYNIKIYKNLHKIYIKIA